jgi:regulator of protease activity HflC (stomatin/prohibitin superfamily)
LRMETPGQAEAEQRAEIIRARGKAQALEVEAEGAKRAEMLRAEGEAAGIATIGEAIAAKGGKDAMAQRIAEQYVTQLADMAKNSSMMIVPDRPNDIAGVMATAMSIANSITAANSE